MLRRGREDEGRSVGVPGLGHDTARSRLVDGIPAPLETDQQAGLDDDGRDRDDGSSQQCELGGGRPAPVSALASWPPLAERAPLLSLRVE